MGVISNKKHRKVNCETPFFASLIGHRYFYHASVLVYGYIAFYILVPTSEKKESKAEEICSLLMLSQKERNNRSKNSKKKEKKIPQYEFLLFNLREKKFFLQETCELFSRELFLFKEIKQFYETIWL